MTRKEQLEYCQVCKNREFDTKQGVICGITKAKATFESSCADFVEDSTQKQKLNKSNDNTVQENSAEFPRVFIWILGLILINILSAIFDWPFWIY
jgi:hypothetical protein